MKELDLTFNANGCASFQLFRLADRLHPKQFSLDLLPVYLESMAQATDAIAVELLQQEKTSRKRNDFSKHLLNARGRAIQLLDIFHDYRRLIGHHHPFTAAYLQCRQLLRNLLVKLKQLFGEAQTGKLKMEDEELAMRRSPLMRRLKTCVQKMKQAGIGGQWIACWYEPIAAGVAGKNNEMLTSRRWDYFSMLVNEVEIQLQAGSLTEQSLQELLLRHNFNNRLFVSAWKNQLLEQLQQQELPVKTDLLLAIRDHVQFLQYDSRESLVPEDTGLKKELVAWIDHQLAPCYSMLDMAAAEAPAAVHTGERISIKAKTALLTCLCKVFQREGFIQHEDLAPVFRILHRVIKLSTSDMPSEQTLIRVASSLTSKDVENLIKLLYSCIKHAEAFKRELIKKEQQKGVVTEKMSKTA
jgi:hypothetical protein